MAPVLDRDAGTLTEQADGWKVVIDIEHPLVKAADDSGIDLTQTSWLAEAVRTVRAIQEGLGCTEEEALAVLNEGGTWAFLTRD